MHESLLDFGPVQVYRTRCVSSDGYPPHRPFRLVGVRRDGSVLRQSGREARLAAGDLVFYDTGRPWQAWAVPDAAPVDGLVLQVAGDVLPLAPAEVQQVLAVRLPGDGGVARVLSAVLEELTARPDRLPPADATRLCTVLVDLAVGVLVAADAPATHGPDAVLREITAYIEDHLRDTTLTPARIAAAHHISLRYLHRLFQQQGMTVAGWTRRRRLDRCRRDLADPLLAHRAVQAIAHRWGFVDESHFGRVFRSTFGTSPAAWRRAYRARSTPAVHGRSTARH